MYKVLLSLRGINPYDHNDPDQLDYNTWLLFHGEEHSLGVIRQQIEVAQKFITKANAAWCTLVLTDMSTGTSETLYREANPVKTRLEINIPAKVAKALPKKLTAATLTMNEILNSHSNLFASSPGTWDSVDPAGADDEEEDEDEDEDQPEEQPQPQEMPF